MQKFIKFGIIGGIGFILDFAFTYLFKEKIGANQYLANGIGFSVAVVNNFYLNKSWTFANKGTKIGVQFGYFLLFSIIGLALNSLFLFLFTQYASLHFYLSKAMAIALVFVWNFSINNYITFKKLVDPA
ncbi:GtrA family protein [Olivibacter domesticus]|uniref:Putative flippase GtrA (Transmembrane translocase of bactoprenol-linked glucose) n=1 Tax=Olivibacter domesticus TaxID=407022 RepID=A0A1H7QIR5_OLID1|nr:GtrA family protein [Olivibacter domesticus]SEL48011.1 Putative flippase GtrA (transmembrane translocase of bactoprenol-linked glucose) [Olivibacter domesticus]